LFYPTTPLRIAIAQQKSGIGENSFELPEAAFSFALARID
jgi:hypothetical protein